MIKVVIVTLILFLLLPCKIYAQGINFTGKIINKETLSPIESSSITVYMENAIIYQTSSDSYGVFKIPPTILRQDCIIKIHSLNYIDIQIDQKKLATHISDKQYFLGTFSLSFKIVSLDGVIIKSKRRYRDTTKIDLSKQKFERSIMIDDLFSKNLGFTKDAQGQIYYNGKIVSELQVNGGSFFGKNNMDIYHLLPALILDNIEVVETNIDSITNTTTLRPSLKVNFKLKEKFKKGKFGNANFGAGTSQRYIANTGLYTYSNKEQISLSLNSNNINTGDNTLLEPKINFTANGNNLTANSARLAYRNLYADKIEVNISANGKIDNKIYSAESYRQEESVNIFSKTFNYSNAKSFTLRDANLNIHYKIDSLNTVDIIQSFGHSHIKSADSLNYDIRFDSLNTVSQLTKIRTTTNNLFNTEIAYQKKYNSKKGRSLNINAKLNNNIYSVNELDNVYNTSSQSSDHYFVNGNRAATENLYTINLNFTDPIGENGYINVFTIYQKDKLDYNVHTNSDTILFSSDAPFHLTNHYLKPGVKFQKTLNKISFDAIINGAFNARNTESNKTNALFLNFNFDFKADYKINTKKNLTWNYMDVTNYPGIQQITSLNNTFDLISQASGNIYLKPEEKRSVKLLYTSRPSDSESIIIGAQFDHYTSKFGYNISNPLGTIQNTTIENIGNSNGGQITFSIFKNVSNNKYFNYTSAIDYQESPTIISKKMILNNGVRFNQSVSTSIQVINTILSLSPELSTSYSKYFYENNSITVLSFTYSDKISLLVKGYQFNLYPLFNYNHNIGSNSSFSINGELKKEIFKTYGFIWIQAYDIFNSFKFYNNYIGASYYQSVKYSNIQRYLLLGISFKFNNMK